MNFSSAKYNQTNDFVKFDILDSNSNKIGNVEAGGDKLGNFACIIIVDSSSQSKGVGFEAFKHAFGLIDKYFKIKTIRANWNSGGLFTSYPNSQSSNLTIYHHNRLKMNPSQSAINTPTGKWCQKIGFMQCQIIEDTPAKVVVDFYI